MDQTEPENQVVYGHKQERGNDKNLDCAVCIPAHGLFEIHIQDG